MITLKSSPLIFGAFGQVGSAISQLLKQENPIAIDQKEADFTHLSSIVDVLEKTNPSFVLNAAAYTAVDLAEKEERMAYQINTEAPGVIAHWCAKKKVPFVHFSTDYVFPGTGEQSWKEEDTPQPLSAYGRTKLGGERLIAEAGGSWLIFRTSWVYNATGKNFLKTMLLLGKERETLQIVNDQIGAPTYAPHLAQATLLALENAKKLSAFPSGIYHLCHAGTTSWHGFARAIFEQAQKKGVFLRVTQLEPVHTVNYPTPALRPLNSRLDTTQAKRILGVSLPDWQDGLKACMEML